MCWYVLERYLYCLTNTSHLTPEFQRHSLGIGYCRHTHTHTYANIFVLTRTTRIIYKFILIHTGLTKDDFAKPNNEDTEEKEEVKEEGDEEEEEEEAPSPPARPGVKVHLTPLELEGLWQLLHKLEELPAHKKCVPAGIRNAPALLSDIRVRKLHHRSSITNHLRLSSTE